jgi:hypothetical protein
MTVYVRLHRGWTVAEALTGRRQQSPERVTLRRRNQPR